MTQSRLALIKKSRILLSHLPALFYIFFIELVAKKGATFDRAHRTFPHLKMPINKGNATVYVNGHAFTSHGFWGSGIYRELSQVSHAEGFSWECSQVGAGALVTQKASRGIIRFQPQFMPLAWELSSWLLIQELPSLLGLCAFSLDCSEFGTWRPSEWAEKPQESAHTAEAANA